MTEEEVAAVKKYVINPVEAREASLGEFDTLQVEYEIPTEVAVLDGFNALDEGGLSAFLSDYGLAMDLADLKFCQD